MIIVSKSLAETQNFAKDFAQKILKIKPTKKALVIALEGELGAGKTTFVQAFAKALGVKENIVSPTFLLLKTYKVKHITYSILVHIDAYRLKDEKDLPTLGFYDFLNDLTTVMLIEWADRVEKALPKDRITIHFDHINESTRKIQISNFK